MSSRITTLLETAGLPADNLLTKREKDLAWREVTGGVPFAAAPTAHRVRIHDGPTVFANCAWCKTGPKSALCCLRIQMSQHGKRCSGMVPAVLPDAHRKRTPIARVLHISPTVSRGQEELENETRDAIRARRKIHMAFRSIAQVMAGVITGAVLVGVPAWAFASDPDDSASPSSDMTGVMSGPGSPSQMMGSMSKMMDDPAMREQMRSMMSDSMDKMSGMPGGGMSGHGTSGMGHMKDMGQGSMSGRSDNQ